MATVVKINTRNDLHLPKEILEAVNLSEDRMVAVEARGNCIILMPVDIEPRYSKEALEGLGRLVAREKDQAMKITSDEQIHTLFRKKRRSK